MINSAPVKPLLWLWLPLLWMVFQIGIELTVPTEALSAIHSENGPHELVQFLVAAAAFFVALFTLLTMDRASGPWLRAWIALATLCCLYVAGEEMSWGQTLLHWTTPSEWMSVNDQGETNLHNTSSWLDQKPRLLLEIGTIVGGLVIPSLRRWRPQALPPKFAAIYPPGTVAVAAALYLAVKLTDSLWRFFFDQRLFIRASEVEELYLYYFVLLYLLSMKARLRCTVAA